MTTPAEPGILLAGTPIRPPCHACAFFHSKEEEHDVLFPFVKDGVAKGEKSFHIVDDELAERFRERLSENGLDSSALEASGQLEIRGWASAHLRPGWFDQHAMLKLVEDVLSGAARAGYEHVRWIADMGWALTDKPGIENLAEYCARLNYLVPRHRATIICTYDIAQFSAAQILDVLRSHPLAVMGGVLNENPFYVPPDEFIRARGASN